MQDLIAFFTATPSMRAVLIIIGSGIVAWLINLIIKRILRRLVAKSEFKYDDILINNINRPVYSSILFLGLFLASAGLPIEQGALQLIGKLLISCASFIWAGYAWKALNEVFVELHAKYQPGSEGMIDDMLPFIKNVLKIGLGLIVMFVLFMTWQIDITPLLASAGVAGIAVGFAAKDTVANLFGGISVFFDRPYKTGDYVIINELYRGEVIEIGMRSTKIRTRDGVLVTVPNSVMVTNPVINETGFDPKLRIRIPLGVAYSTDLSRAEQVIVNTVAEYPEILDNPAPRIRYRRFGDSAVELEVLGVISEPADRGRIMHELIKLLKGELEKVGIKMPYPQQDVHVFHSDKSAE